MHDREMWDVLLEYEYAGLLIYLYGRERRRVHRLEAREAVRARATQGRERGA